MNDKSNMKEKLNQIIRLFSNLDLVMSDDCQLMADSGYDETIMIGTKSSLLVLAMKLVEFVLACHDDNLNSENCTVARENMNGINYYSTDTIKKLFDDMADVWPVCLFIAESNEAVKALGKLIREG